MAWVAFGVDVGGTTIKIGLFDQAGACLNETRIPTRTADAGKAILSDIANAVREMKAAFDGQIAEHDYAGIGMGLPGPVDADGVVDGCVNLGWDGKKDAARELSVLTGMPVVAGNDANVAALGEMWLGGGKGYQDVVMVTLGTGVGGGMVLGGRLVPGAHGAAGEIGHIHVKDGETDTCNCGGHGCLEQYAGAPGIIRETRRYLAAHPDAQTTLRNQTLDAKGIFDAAKAGDPVGMAIATATGEKLGRALATIACVVDPGIFVIGGGIAAAGDILLDPVKEAYQQTAFHACKDTPFTFAKLGNRAGMVGCVKLLMDAQH